MAAQFISPISGTKLGIDSTKKATKDFTPIPDAPNNPEIIALANWAVDEVNKEQKLALKFPKVFGAYVNGTDFKTYLILLEAVDGGITKRYEAGVLETPPNSKTLVSFGLIEN